jgi:hypothetical protein
VASETLAPFNSSLIVNVFGEDGSGIRLPTAVQMLAILNSLMLSLMDLHQVTNVARQIRRFSFSPDEAIAWVL